MKTYHIKTSYETTDIYIMTKNDLYDTNTKKCSYIIFFALVASGDTLGLI